MTEAGVVRVVSGEHWIHNYQYRPDHFSARQIEADADVSFTFVFGLALSLWPVLFLSTEMNY